MRKIHLALDDFYKQKIAALLHDPPSKCWFLDGTRGKLGHETDANVIASGLFGSEMIAKMLHSGKVKKADRLASSLDRWLLEVAMGGKYEPNAYKVSSSKILNQFTKGELEFENVNTAKPANFDVALTRFIARLRNLLEEDAYQNRWREIYHILYASLEYSWTKEIGIIGPADTRVPTHSIFDHLYATATALNMLDENRKLSGYIVTIDLAGIQGFISAARKMRDLWAGSWLVSALSWSIVEEFVKILGPDTLLLPTARGNPFYFHTFRGLVQSSGREQEYSAIGKEFYGYDGYPRNPVMPGTISFILPKREDILSELAKETRLDFGDKGEIASSIRKIFQQKWRELSSSLADEEHNEECVKLRVFDVPPLRLRVAVEEISDSTSSEEEGLHGGESHRPENHARSAEYLAYHRAFHNAAKSLRGQAKLKISPFVDLNVGAFTSEKYYVCHVCGILPTRTQKNEYGERLCAYCAIRRNLTAEFGRSLESLFHFKGEHRENLWIESVSDVAARPFIRKLCETQNDEVRKAAQNHRHSIPWIESCEELRKGWRFLKELSAEKQLYGGEEEGKTPQERKEKRAENRQKASSLLLSLSKAGFKERLNQYYAILRVDADNMGKLISGLLGQSIKKNGYEEHGGVSSLDFELFSHLSRSTENRELRSVAEAIRKEEFDEAAEVAKKFSIGGRSRVDLANDFRRLHNRLKEGCSLASHSGKNERVWQSNLILSPSYHATLSRALMKLATETARIIQSNDGELIYAGGDDVLAILPAEKALATAREIRNRFRQGENGKKGFLELIHGSQAYIQSMGDLGVSMSILFTHYKYPLSISLVQSKNNEDEFAKKSKWFDLESLPVEKDSLALAYFPRGGQSTMGLIPLNDDTKVDLLVQILDLTKHSDNRNEKKATLSNSFLRDLLQYYDRIDEAYNSSPEIAKSMLRRVISRNCNDPYSNKDVIDRLTENLFKTLATTRTTTGTKKEENKKEDKRLTEEIIKASLAIGGAIA